MNLIEKARFFARVAHNAVGQDRKYTGEPYWQHVYEVAKMVGDYTSDEDVIAAAYLHDILEDTKITGMELVVVFNARVASIVFNLTDVFTSQIYPELNRGKRKKREADRLGRTDAETQLIKVADVISNTESIVKHDKEFAEVYLEEKEYLLSRLTLADETLLAIAKDQLTWAKKVVSI